MSLSIIDIVLALLVAYGFYLGFSNGIIKTFFSILSIVVGVMAAVRFSPKMTELLKTLFGQSSSLMHFVGIGATFLIAMLLLRMFARGLEGILESANINIVNQLAGGILLTGLFIFLYSWVLMFLDGARLLNDGTKKNSISYAFLQTVPDQAKDIWQDTSPAFRNFWNHTLDAFDKLDNIVEKTETLPEFKDLPDEEAESEPKPKENRGPSF